MLNPNSYNSTIYMFTRHQHGQEQNKTFCLIGSFSGSAMFWFWRCGGMIPNILKSSDHGAGASQPSSYFCDAAQPLQVRWWKIQTNPDHFQSSENRFKTETVTTINLKIKFAARQSRITLPSKNQGSQCQNLKLKTLNVVLKWLG